MALSMDLSLPGDPDTKGCAVGDGDAAVVSVGAQRGRLADAIATLGLSDAQLLDTQNEERLTQLADLEKLANRVTDLLEHRDKLLAEVRHCRRAQMNTVRTETGLRRQHDGYEARLLVHDALTQKGTIDAGHALQAVTFDLQQKLTADLDNLLDNGFDVLPHVQASLDADYQLIGSISRSTVQDGDRSSKILAEMKAETIRLSRADPTAKKLNHEGRSLQSVHAALLSNLDSLLGEPDTSNDVAEPRASSEIDITRLHSTIASSRRMRSGDPVLSTDTQGHEFAPLPQEATIADWLQTPHDEVRGIGSLSALTLVGQFTADRHHAQLSELQQVQSQGNAHVLSDTMRRGFETPLLSAIDIHAQRSVPQLATEWRNAALLASQGRRNEKEDLLSTWRVQNNTLSDAMHQMNELGDSAKALRDLVSPD